MTARRVLPVALALLLVELMAVSAVGGPSLVHANSTPWSISVSPTSLIEGVATDVTVTVTAGNQHLGYVPLDVPAGFTVVSTRVVSVPAGDVWGSAGAGAGPKKVTFGTTQDPWRLDPGEQGVFIVRVIATSRPAPAWSAEAYQKFWAEPDELADGPAQPLAPFVITRGPTPTPRPTPKATPKPTPRSTPAPSHTPSPSPVASSLVGSPTPTASPSSSPSSGPAGAVAGSGDLGGGTNLDVRALPAGGTVTLDDIAAVGTIGMFAWLVPGLFLGLPGLLILLVVAAQAGLATAFVPLTRRVLGEPDRRRGHPEGRSHVAQK
jgi:hypothetical protein